MRDDHEGPVVLGESELQLLDRFEIEMIRRFVEDQNVHATCLLLGEVGPRPLAWRERRGRTADVVGAEPELREQGSGVDTREAGALDELVDEELAAVGDAGGLETAAEVLQPAVITAIDHHSQRIASA